MNDCYLLSAEFLFTQQTYYVDKCWLPFKRCIKYGFSTISASDLLIPAQEHDLSKVFNVHPGLDY